MKIGLTFFAVLMAVCSSRTFADIQTVILHFNKTNYEEVSTTEATTTTETTMLPVKNPMEYYLLSGCDIQYSDCQRLVKHELVPSLEFCETEKNDCERKVYQITATTTITLETTVKSTTMAPTTTTLNMEEYLFLQCNNNYTECLHLIDQALVPSLEFCENEKKECERRVRELIASTATTVEATSTMPLTIGGLTATTSTLIETTPISTTPLTTEDYRSLQCNNNFTECVRLLGPSWVPWVELCESERMKCYTQMNQTADTTTTMPSTAEPPTTITVEDYLLSLCKSRYDDCNSLSKYGKMPSLQFCESEKDQCDQNVRQIADTTMETTSEGTTKVPISKTTTTQYMATTNIETKKELFACVVELEWCRFTKKSDKCDANYAECNQKVVKITTVPTVTTTTLPPMTLQECRKDYRSCKQNNFFEMSYQNCMDTLESCQKAVRDAYRKQNNLIE
uniref:DUF725 domain-containing protein n=1 Tax=Panagrellus redivivus TaxID=6233 RepID=A0A7E4VCK9_PANRE